MKAIVTLGWGYGGKDETEAFSATTGGNLSGPVRVSD